MWLFAMFDLPVDTKEARRDYCRFRNLLLDSGFSQMQYSVYARFCGSEEISDSYRRKIQLKLPPDGYVRLLAVTDRQFGKMQNFHGKKRAPNEAAPTQLLLF
ncbi:CRISPR-associated endonuclease Cas2 [Planctomicrobium sp. SH668]|uniref:CRISPR-associated endonuclease Cas2 n=1 Tax=Planctomicrobium sp. SH668 TaxID=3448126 RepID=UPI003F5AEEEA